MGKMNVVKMKKTYLNVHGMIPNTTSNGPGVRACIWVQGCSLKCKGCINPDSQSHDARYLVPVDDIVDWILSIDNIEGVTISGGEPFEQSEAVSELVDKISNNIGRKELSLFVFTGYNYGFLQESENHYIQNILDKIDILCSGPYVESKRSNSLLWRGSDNQELIYLSERYNRTLEKQWKEISTQEEILINDENIKTTGITSNLEEMIKKLTSKA